MDVINSFTRFRVEESQINKSNSSENLAALKKKKYEEEGRSFLKSNIYYKS